MAVAEAAAAAATPFVVLSLLAAVYILYILPLLVGTLLAAGRAVTGGLGRAFG